MLCMYTCIVIMFRYCA